MKSPIEKEEKTTGMDAEILRRQYFGFTETNGQQNSEKTQTLLTPFLLSLPVIIMLIILIYSL